MALKKFRTAEQDQWGRFWAVNEDGNRIPVQPYSDEDFSGYRQIDAGSGDEGGGSSIPNAPAGLSPDAWRLQSGDVLPPEMIAQAVQSLNVPGAYVGVDGMTMDQYLADPRAAVQVENGQFVFRPEQMQGDFESIDRESFLQAAMPFFAATLPFVLGPYAASLGALTSGAAGAASAAASEGAAALSALPAELSNFTLAGPGTGIGGVGSANVGFNAAGLGLTPELVAAGGGAGAMGLSGGLGLTLPATGAIPSAAAALEAGLIPSSGAFSDVINLPSFTNPMEVPTSAVAPSTPLETSIPALDVPAPTLAQPGQGIGGVGTAGQGLSLGSGSTGGAIGTTAAELAAAGGVTLPALSGIGAGTGAGLGLNLPAGGAIGSATGIGSGIGSGLTVPTSAAAATAAGGNAALSQALQRILSGNATQADIAQLFGGGNSGPDWGGLATAGIQAATSKYLANKYDTLARDLSDRADPFGSENVKGARAQAKNEYLTQYSGGPTAWMEGTYKPFAEANMDMALRKLSASRGNPALSPGALAEAVKFTTSTGYNDYMRGRQQVASEAGAGVNPGSAAQIYAQQAGNAIQQLGNVGGAIGSAVGSVMGNRPSGGSGGTTGGSGNSSGGMIGALGNWLAGQLPSMSTVTSLP